MCYWCIPHQIFIKLRTLLGIPPSHLLSLLLCFFCFFRYFCYRHFIVGRWLPARSWVPWLIEELFSFCFETFAYCFSPSPGNSFTLIIALPLAMASNVRTYSYPFSGIVGKLTLCRTRVRYYAQRKKHSIRGNLVWTIGQTFYKELFRKLYKCTISNIQ